MSLEQILTETNALLRQLIDSNGYARYHGVIEHFDPTPNKLLGVGVTVTAQAAPAVESTPIQPEPQAPSTPLQEVTYDEVRDLVLNVLMRPPFGRETTVLALKEFGAETAKELKPEQYAAFIARAKELTSATVA